MKLLFAALLLAASSVAQISWTPPVKPTAAVPGKLVIPTATVTASLVGNAVPATAVTITITVAGVAIAPYTIPFQAPAGTLIAYTFQQNYGTDAVTVILKQNAAAGIDFQASSNGGTAVTGTF